MTFVQSKTSLLVGLGHAEHVADDLQRQRRGERLHEVALALLGRLGDELAGADADALLDRGDRLRRERPLHEQPQLRVARVVEHDHRAEELAGVGRVVATT